MTSLITHFPHFTKPAKGDVKRVLVRLFQAPEGLFETLMCWQYRYQERARLAELPPRALADMGIDADRLNALLAKPFRQF
ncbi:MAG: DUF1127 domain-containing protein [Proteobacteria bacterium]|nr:DUF1127 domain-containing protein [Pseudomonadota bacterium]